MQRFVLHQLTFYDDTSGENAPCYNYNAGLASGGKWTFSAYDTGVAVDARNELQGAAGERLPRIRKRGMSGTWSLVWRRQAPET